MLEIIIPGIRHGDGVISCSTAYRGMICYISGINSDGKPVLRVPYSSAQAWGAVYPINKIYYGADYGDTADAVDLIPDGSDIVYYEGGEYETDQWYPSSFGLTAGYWATLEDVSSSYGSHINKTGFSTSLATFSTFAYRCYPIAYQLAIGGAKGTLGAYPGQIGGHHSAGGFAPSGGGAQSGGMFAYALGIHGTSSADARLRYRIIPGVIGRAAIGGAATDPD